MKRFLLLLLLSAGAFLLPFSAPGDIFLDFGPNDRRYVSGFREDFEIDEPTLIHWSTDRARVRLPFHVRSPYEVLVRFKRHIERPAEVRLFLEGEPAESFVVPQQDFEVRRLRSPAPRGGAFELGLVTSSEDPRPLGLALDWMAVRPGGGILPVIPTASAWLALLSWVVVFYALPRMLGLGERVALALGAGAAACLTAAALAHKLWPVHAAMTLGLRAHAALLLLALFHSWRRGRYEKQGSIWREPLARWAVLVVCAALSIRLFALFHPDFYYPDVRTHSKFVSLIWTEGLSGFLTNHIENQHRHLLGLQFVSGRWVAFPYPPLLYLTIYPLSLLQLPVEDWMKLVPAALLSVEALALFAIGGKLGLAPRTSFLAVLLHASARVLAFRLAVASYAALFGHFWDMLAVLYIAFFFERLHRPWYGAGLGLLVAISILSYAGSVLTLGLFVPLLGIAVLLTRAGRPSTVLALTLWPLAGALLAAFLFYVSYLPELLGTSAANVAPSADSGFSGLVELKLTPGAALAMAFYRLRLFYAWPYTLVSLALLAGFFARRGRGALPLALPLALAASATYLGMNFLRAGLGSTHIFQFSKDDLVILPVVALLLGGFVGALWGKGRGAQAVALALLLGWIGWGLSSLARDVEGRFRRPGYPPSPGSGGQVQEAKTTRLPPARFAS